MNQSYIIVLFCVFITSSCIVKQKVSDENDETLYISNDKRFTLDSTGFIGESVLDTIFFSDAKIMVIKNVALESNLTKSNLKVGAFSEYYFNGQIKSQGNFQIDTYLQCCSHGYCRRFVNFKNGFWEYYFKNGQVKAKGVYAVKKEKINTSCKGGDMIFKSRVDSSWKYYNEKGNEISLTDSLKIELENTIN